MKRALRNSTQFGMAAVLVASLLTSTGWTQHHGGGGHGGGGHSFGGHSGFGGHGGFGGHSSLGGHGYGGHSSYGSHSILGGHGYGSHSNYGSHSILGGHGYGGHSSFGSLGGHGSGGYGHGGLGIGLHYSGYGHHSYYPHYDGHFYYGGSYPYYADYGISSLVPYYGYTYSEPVVVARPVIADDSSSIATEMVAKPIVQGSSDASVSATNVASSDSYRQSAEKAFRAGQFGEAARLANHALVEDSSNVNLHLLLSHALFAVGDYRGAAMAIHRAAAIGGTEKLGYHVKNWRDLYRNVSYTNAMNRLNSFIGENPDDAAARFLRGYHFMFLDNHSEYAARELAKAVELEPNDRLAEDLLAMLTDPDVKQPRLGAETKGVPSAPANSDSHEHAGHEHP